MKAGFLFNFNAAIQRSLASIVLLPFTASYKFDQEKIDPSAAKTLCCGLCIDALPSQVKYYSSGTPRTFMFNCVHEFCKLVVAVMDEIE